MYFYSERGNFHLRFSCIIVCKRLDNGSYLEPKHLALNKWMIKLVLDVADTNSCDLLIAAGMFRLRK
jgi:hypothetical protein